MSLHGSPYKFRLAGGGAVVMRLSLPIGAAVARQAGLPPASLLCSLNLPHLSPANTGHHETEHLQHSVSLPTQFWVGHTLTHQTNKLIRNCRNVPTVKLD